MIIYTPLDIPKIEPNNWDEWWDVWNEHAAPIIKRKRTPNHADYTLWKGFDLYKTPALLNKPHAYDAVMAPEVPVILDLIEQVKNHAIFTPVLIRVIENIIPVLPHYDNIIPNSYQFRSVLWNTYKTPIWNFTYENETRNMILPEDTNSFYYLDYPVKHESIHDPLYSKGLLLVYGKLKIETNELVERSINKYKDIAWVV